MFFSELVKLGFKKLKKNINFVFTAKKYDILFRDLFRKRKFIGNDK